MKNNQKGFTYPLTLCLLVLFLLFFSMHIERLQSKRMMAHETAAILQQEYYFLSSVKKIEVIFQAGGSIPSKGTITYINGTMDYQAETPSGYVQKVNFTLRTKAGDAIFCRGFFDTRTKKLIKWVELK
ncbi:competence type IV pilus minor pilin ComGG [Neobacillus sp. NPDC093127]|uniref:competence type IV pilus minor pilin ComGG n=1 Tax=Neobacillus sp. NPDC093127 TaxID=3364296 RepID=UPI003810FB52